MNNPSPGFSSPGGVGVVKIGDFQIHQSRWAGGNIYYVLMREGV